MTSLSQSRYWDWISSPILQLSSRLGQRQCQFNRRWKKKFDEHGIEIPFPHMTLYMGEDKTGQAAPLRVQAKVEGEHGSKQQ
jgi:small-conductance mechanosensitive channel